MKVQYILIFVFLSFLLPGCSSNSEFSERTFTYNELPKDVRDKFKEVYDEWHPPYFDEEEGDTLLYQAPFVEAYNLDGDSVKIISNANIFNPFSNSFTITSSGKRIKFTLAILERVFIIKGDSIFYPITGKGCTTYGEPRSYDVNVDTLIYKVSKMKCNSFF